MELKNFKHELVYTDTGYEVIFHLADNLEEISDELGSKSLPSKEEKYKVVEYIKKLYPNINVQAIKFMTGTILAATILLPAHPQNKVYAQPTQIVKSNNIVTIVMGDYYIRPDVEAFLLKDRAMIPLRAISEVFGAEVTWDQKSKLVTIKRSDNEIKLWVGSKLAISDKSEYNMDIEPVIVSNRVMVPMRFVMEVFGIDLQWEQNSNTVFINYDKKFTLDYLVQSGDSLEKIASKFDVSIENLRLWNNIKGNIIYAGQFIKVASPFLEQIISSMDKIEIKEYDFDTVLGYTVRDYPSHTSSYNSLSKYHNRLTEISTFTHKLKWDGSLEVDYMQDDILRVSKEKGLNNIMLIHNSTSNGFDKDLGKSVLKSHTKRQKLINNIYEQLNKFGYNGVEIDFENLPPESRNDYNQFMKELYEKLKPEGFTISCSLPAKTGEDNETWLRAYDYSTIGKYADRVLIMSYDQHWLGGAPGPIASIEWVERVAQYASSAIEPDKLLLGIATYGYDWPADGSYGKSVTVSNVNKYLDTYGGKVKWNENAKAPYYEYTDNNNVKRIVWFENTQSAQFKFEIAKRYGFKGVGIWRLGLENNEFWTGLKSKQII